MEPVTSSKPRYLREDRLTQQCQDLLPTLTSERGWVSSRLYSYQGFWHEKPRLNGILSCQNRFQARDCDIFLATFPKSGITWFKAVLYALSGRFRHASLGMSLVNNPHDLIPFLEMGLYFDDVIPDLSSLESPRVFATHMPYVSLPQSMKDSECKIIYICRNPKDTFVSMWHFANKIKPKDERGENDLDAIFDLFCRGVCPFGPWWDHVLQYWKASQDMPRRVLFLKYEEMKERPGEVLRKVAEFIGCPFMLPEEEDMLNEILRICSFENLRGLEVNKSGRAPSGVENKFYFRKGEVRDWPNTLSLEMAEKLYRIVDEKLHDSGLKF